MKRTREEGGIVDVDFNNKEDLDNKNELSAEQQKVIDLVKQKYNVFFTGPAGTGKSTILREIMKLDLDIAVCAPTGIAACNVGGVTLHSFFGLGAGNIPSDEVLIAMEKNYYLKQKIYKTELIVIDEISMVSAELFDLIDHVCQFVRHCRRPFGGIQLVLCGDFYQLPPVINKADEAPEDYVFAFDSRAWKYCIHKTVVLKTIYRQQDPVFANILNLIRTGHITPEVNKLITSRALEWKPDPEKDPKTIIKPTRLFSTNESVDLLNEKELAALTEQDPELDVQSYAASDFVSDPKYSKILHNCSLPKNLQLCIGAQVVMLTNKPKRGVYNGSRGVVIGFNGMFPIVQFANGAMQVTYHRHEGLKYKKKKTTVLYSRLQIPLRLAWALTIHKSQGMSLDKVEINMERLFACGQGYVALSRATNLNELYVKGWGYGKKIIVDERVKDFYNSLTNIN